MSLWNDPNTTLHVIERIAAISVCISSLELLVYPAQLNDKGLMSWRVFQLRHHRFAEGNAALLLSRIFSYPAFLVLIAIRLVAAAILVIGPQASMARALLAGSVAILSLCLPLRSPYGLDGADQMSTNTFIALALVHCCASTTATKAGLLFLTLQVCLSYFTAGATKAFSPVWRDGTGLTGVFCTTAYGNPWLATRLAAHPRLGKAMSWSVIIGECSFPLVLLVPMPFALIFLAWGVTFHLLGAMIMGLNTFFWSYVSLYPALLYFIDQGTFR